MCQVPAAMRYGAGGGGRVGHVLCLALLLQGGEWPSSPNKRSASTLLMAAAKECGNPPSGPTLAGPVEWDGCLEVRVVLVWNSNSPTLPNSEGKEGGTCVTADKFVDETDQSFIKVAEDCPLGWNCVGSGGSLRVCQNGLYCDSDTNTCEQCSQCNFNSDAVSGSRLPSSCGNCKTRFYPALDEYSAFRLLDSCGQYDGMQEECALSVGCTYKSGSCLPGPLVEYDSSDKTFKIDSRQPNKATDENTLFRPHQEFMLEMGSPTEGYGMVRSPIVIYADDSFEIISMYASISVKEGYPRKISWEQTKDISSACTPSVRKVMHASNNRSSILAQCIEPGSADPKICDPALAGKMFMATDCGFSTLVGYKVKTEGNPDPVFKGMLWPLDSSDGEENERRRHANDCTQNMCAQAATAQVEPLQIYVTWKGDDDGGREMSSTGLSYEAFRQFSAFEAFQNAKEAASGVVARSRKCIAAKKCDD